MRARLNIVVAFVSLLAMYTGVSAVGPPPGVVEKL